MRVAVLEVPNQDLVAMDGVEIAGSGLLDMRLPVAHSGVCHPDLDVARPGRQSPSRRIRGRSQPSGRLDDARLRTRRPRPGVRTVLEIDA